MDKTDVILAYHKRAKQLLLGGVWSETVEDAYWQLKEELFKSEGLWELEKPRYYWSDIVKNRLYSLKETLHYVWRLQFTTK